MYINLSTRTSLAVPYHEVVQPWTRIRPTPLTLKPEYLHPIEILSKQLMNVFATVRARGKSACWKLGQHHRNQIQIPRSN